MYVSYEDEIEERTPVKDPGPTQTNNADKQSKSIEFCSKIFFISGINSSDCPKSINFEKDETISVPLIKTILQPEAEVSKTIVYIFPLI